MLKLNNHTWKKYEINFCAKKVTTRCVVNVTIFSRLKIIGLITATRLFTILRKCFLSNLDPTSYLNCRYKEIIINNYHAAHSLVGLYVKMRKLSTKCGLNTCSRLLHTWVLFLREFFFHIKLQSFNLKGRWYTFFHAFFVFCFAFKFFRHSEKFNITTKPYNTS